MRIVMVLIATVVHLGIAHADECDLIVGQLVDKVQGLKVVERKIAESLEDTVTMRHAEAQGVSVLCPDRGIRYARLNVDFDTGAPGPAYFTLVGDMGAAVTNAPAEQVRAGAQECQRPALASKSMLGRYRKDGILFQCATLTRASGKTLMTVSRPAASQR
jgi:hypothetical protein